MMGNSLGPPGRWLVVMSRVAAVAPSRLQVQLAWGSMDDREDATLSEGELEDKREEEPVEVSAAVESAMTTHGGPILQQPGNWPLGQPSLSSVCPCSWGNRYWGVLNGVSVSGTEVVMESGRSGSGAQDLAHLLAGLKDVLGQLAPLPGAGYKCNGAFGGGRRYVNSGDWDIILSAASSSRGANCQLGKVRH